MNTVGVHHQERAQDEVLAEYDAVVSSQERAHAAEFRQFLAGAGAALGWVLGHTTIAPASGNDEAPTVAAMRDEERLCDQIIYAAEPHPALDPDYANGVEHALSWVRGEEEIPPTPLELVVTDPARLCACG